MEDIKNSQMENLELKNTVTKIKSLIDGQQQNEQDRRISKLEDRTIEVTQSEEQRK